jgi:predicted ATP-dependent serine protease
MWVLQRAREFDSSAGTPIPTVFEKLKLASAEFRYGQVSLIAAAPGIGKSALVLQLALGAGVPTLYFSADSDAGTQYSRAAAMVTGEKLAFINESITKKQVSRFDMALNKARHIRFVFDSAPSLDDVDAHVMAYGYAFGQWPKLIIVDNVSDLFTETEGFQGLEEAMDFLAELARKTGAHIVALHHVVGEYESGDKIVPLGGLKGKISKKPTLILTLNRVAGAEDQLNIAIVKNRAGIASASGAHSVWLKMDLSRMWIETALPKLGVAQTT